jgi:hypothetical protein
MAMTPQELSQAFSGLRPWSKRADFTAADWRAYVRVARLAQNTDPQVLDDALDLFIRTAVQEPFTGSTSESKPFLLLRVMFDLPESAPAESRRIYKGWINWPPPDREGRVSLAWPIAWRSGQPELMASYEGSEGQPYRAAAEYRHFRTAYRYRVLPEA